MGDDLWLLDTGATGHFTYDPRLLESYAELSAVGCYVVQEVTLPRSWGPAPFVYPFDLGRGWSV